MRRESFLLSSIAFVATFIVASEGRCENYVVVFAVSDNPKEPSVALSSAQLFSATMAQTIPPPKGALLTYYDHEVTPQAIEEILEVILPQRLESEDSLIVYYAGKGEIETVDGYLTRVYATHEAPFTDIDLEEWLRPLRKKGTQVSFIAECHFQRSAHPRDMATFELTVTSELQASPFVVLGFHRVGAFTHLLCNAFTSIETPFSLEDVATKVEEDMARQFPDQTLHRRGIHRIPFGTAQRFDLQVAAEDRLDGRTLKGVKIRMAGFPTRETPAEFSLSVNQPSWTIRAEQEGYVTNVATVTKEDFGPHFWNSETLLLTPHHSVIHGRIVTAIPMDGIRLGYELDQADTAMERAFDGEEIEPNKQGRFSMRVPSGFKVTVFIFDVARFVAAIEVHDGDTLNSSFSWNENTDSVDLLPYDLGDVIVSDERRASSPAEMQFAYYLDHGDKKPIGTAYEYFERAQSILSLLPVESRAFNEERVRRAFARIAPDLQDRKRKDTLKGLEQKAEKALAVKDLDAANTLARVGIKLNEQSGGDESWPEYVLEEIRFRRLQKELNGREFPRVSPNDQGDLDIEGFTFSRVNAQGVREYRHDQTGLEFLYIPEGEFEMGSPPNEQNRNPAAEMQRRVKTSSFLIAKYEVSQGLWQDVMNTNPSQFNKGRRYPVENVSWLDVLEFCVRAGLELPSEAQWERACRAGTDTPFAFGESVSAAQVNYGDNGEDPFGSCRNETLPVDSLLPNPWGLFNMHGNVWEWCWDEFNTYTDDFVIDPRGPDEYFDTRIVRGGAWSWPSGASRSAFRFCFVPPYADDGQVGFRPARSLK